MQVSKLSTYSAARIKQPQNASYKNNKGLTTKNQAQILNSSINFTGFLGDIFKGLKKADQYATSKAVDGIVWIGEKILPDVKQSVAKHAKTVIERPSDFHSAERLVVCAEEYGYYPPKKLLPALKKIAESEEYTPARSYLKKLFKTMEEKSISKQ